MHECSLHDKKECVVHITTLKQVLNHELVSQKVHKVNGFNEKAWLNPHIDMNAELGKNAKNDFVKDFFKLMNS